MQTFAHASCRKRMELKSGRLKLAGRKNAKLVLVGAMPHGFFPRISSPFCFFAFLGSPLFSTHQEKHILLPGF